MPRRAPYVPKHRGPRADPTPSALRTAARPALTSRRGLHRTLATSAVAMAAIGLAVSSGVLLGGDSKGDAASAALASHQLHEDRTAAGSSPAGDLADRELSVSRSVERQPVDTTKARALDQDSGGQVTRTEDVSGGDPRTMAKALLPRYGFGADQFSCLDSIYSSESGWDVHADNPTSSAYGIPQALPGAKMASAGPKWQNDAATQIRWGLGYIKNSYGTPCAALSFREGHGWY